MPSRYHLEPAPQPSDNDFRQQVLIWLAWVAVVGSAVGTIARLARGIWDIQTYTVALVAAAGLAVAFIARNRRHHSLSVVLLLGSSMLSALVAASQEGGVFNQTAIWMPIILFAAYAVGGIGAGRALAGISIVGYTALAFVSEASYPTSTHTALDAYWSGSTALVGSAVVFELYERARARSAALVRLSENELRTLIGALPDVVLHADADGAVKRAASGSGQPVHGPTDSLLQQALTMLGPQVDEVAEHRTPTDTELHCEDEAQTIFAASLRPLGRRETLIVLRDITEKRAMERRLHKSERLSSLGRMASAVGHELNNPLAVVSLNLAYLRHAMDDGEQELQSITDESIQALERMSGIVADLRQFAEERQQAPELAPLEDLVGHALDLAHHALKNAVNVEVTLAPEKPRVRVVAAQVLQVFVNLLLNAVQAMPPHRSDNRIHIRITSTGTLAQVAMEDNGRGIATDALPHVFEPAYASQEGGSTDASLVLCRDVIAAHGGKIEVESELGSGSTFTVSLPMADAPATSSSAAAHVPWHTIAAGASVLIVDDEAALGEALARSMEGARVALATSGLQALALLREQHFDHVLCDVMMPVMTGPELHARAIQEHPDAARRFVFMTGGVVSDEAQSYLDQTKVRLLRKPVQPHALDEAFRQSAAEALSASKAGSEPPDTPSE